MHENRFISASNLHTTWAACIHMKIVIWDYTKIIKQVFNLIYWDTCFELQTQSDTYFSEEYSDVFETFCTLYASLSLSRWRRQWQNTYYRSQIVLRNSILDFQNLLTQHWHIHVHIHMHIYIHRHRYSHSHSTHYEIWPGNGFTIYSGFARALSAAGWRSPGSPQRPS